MDDISCTRVGPPAKPSREKVIAEAVRDALRHVTKPVSERVEAVAADVERAIAAWEADESAPTFRFDLSEAAVKVLIGNDQQARAELIQGIISAAYRTWCDSGAPFDFLMNKSLRPSRCPGGTVSAEVLAKAFYDEVTSRRDASASTWSGLLPGTRDAWITAAASIIMRFFPEHAIRPVSRTGTTPPTQSFEVADGESFIHRRSGWTWIFLASGNAGPDFQHTWDADVPPDLTATP